MKGQEQACAAALPSGSQVPAASRKECHVTKETVGGKIDTRTGMEKEGEPLQVRKFEPMYFPYIFLSKYI